MSLECFIGPEGNVLETSEAHANRLKVPHPIISNEELSSLKDMDHRGWRSKTIDITFERSHGHEGFISALSRICIEAEEAIAEGYSLVILSDRNISAERMPISALIACGAVHHHLNKMKTYSDRRRN